MILSPISSSMGYDWWNSRSFPTRILDQHFGCPLLDDDMLAPMMYRGFLLRPRTETNVASSGHSEVVNDKDKFQVMLNVSQFAPDEIEVKTVDNYVVIHAKHEEKSDEHGFVSREFTRRYMIPHGIEPESVTSSLSQDGVLSVTAPRKAIELPPQVERNVPISVK